jgi:hypothetical protein
VLGEQQLSQVADGAILVNVGHSDREIDVDWLDRLPRTPVRRHLERFELDGRRVYLLNRGRQALRQRAPPVRDGLPNRRDRRLLCQDVRTWRLGRH